MSYKIHLNTRDGQDLVYDCKPGQTLIDAADAANIWLPSQCRQGSCGACHATVATGDYTLGEHSSGSLPAESEKHGAILMCRTTAQSDLAITLPYDSSRIQFHKIPRRSAEIAAVETVADNTIRLELRLDEDQDYGIAADFEPGQFVELEIPGTELSRAYSIANTPNWEGVLEFFIRLQPNGRFSGFLRDSAQSGMKIMMRGPQGAFGLDNGSLRPRWFLAGGTGVAPLLSMLRRMAEYQDLTEARLFFGVTRESELFALDELEQLKSELPQLKVEVCVWKPDNGWNGFIGTPVDALRAALSRSETLPDVYLCGSPLMIDAAQAAATEAGIPAARVYSERCLPS